MGFLFLSLTMLAGLLALIVGGTLLFIRVVFSLILLPLRIVGGLLLFPFWVARGVLKVASLALILPVLLVGGIVLGAGLMLAAVVAALVPLLPFVLLGLIAWVLVRLFSRPALVRS